MHLYFSLKTAHIQGYPLLLRATHNYCAIPPTPRSSTRHLAISQGGVHPFSTVRYAWERLDLSHIFPHESDSDESSQWQGPKLYMSVFLSPRSHCYLLSFWEAVSSAFLVSGLFLLSHHRSATTLSQLRLLLSVTRTAIFSPVVIYTSIIHTVLCLPYLKSARSGTASIPSQSICTSSWICAQT